MSSRPRIGITSRKVPYFHRERPYPRYGVAVDYIHAVEVAGGLPLMLPLSRDPSLLEDYFAEYFGEQVIACDRAAPPNSAHAADRRDGPELHSGAELLETKQWKRRLRGLGLIARN